MFENFNLSLISLFEELLKWPNVELNRLLFEGYQFSPQNWYQNSPISVRLNWLLKQYHSGLTRFGPIFWDHKLALFILQCNR